MLPSHNAPCYQLSTSALYAGLYTTLPQPPATAGPYSFCRQTYPSAHNQQPWHNSALYPEIFHTYALCPNTKFCSQPATLATCSLPTNPLQSAHNPATLATCSLPTKPRSLHKICNLCTMLSILNILFDSQPTTLAPCSLPTTNLHIIQNPQALIL
jgi:hypothetical protein